MIDDLQAANTQTRADRDERRQAREMRGEYFDDPLPQRFVRKTFETPQQPQQRSSGITDAEIDGMVSFINERINEELDPLREKLSLLTTQMMLLRAKAGLS